MHALSTVLHNMFNLVHTMYVGPHPEIPEQNPVYILILRLTIVSVSL